MRKQHRPEGSTTSSQSRSSIAKKANAANSSRQKQANDNRSRTDPSRQFKEVKQYFMLLN